MIEEEEKKISKFSSGINIIMRLDSLWKDTHSHSRNGQFTRWNSDLDRIWLELARDLDKKDYETEEKKFNDLDNKLIKRKTFHDSPPPGFAEITADVVKERQEIYADLMKKQLFLARLENKLGKGTTFDEGDEDDFD